MIKFRQERDWEQFHNPKDLAIALSIEASELLETFLWKTYDQAEPEKIQEELADVFAYALLLAHHYGLDFEEIVKHKIQKNALKYPPRVRALLGAILQQMNPNLDLSKLKSSLNPISIYKLGIDNSILKAAEFWNIR